MVEKIGDSVVWGPEQEVSLLRFDDCKCDYVRVETGEHIVDEIDERNGWTSKTVLFLAELIDLKPDSRVGYVASKLAAQMVEEEAIYQEAKRQCQEMVLQTQTRLAEMRKASNDYMDDALRRTEEAIASSLEDVRDTRAKFKALLEAQEKRSGGIEDINE